MQKQRESKKVKRSSGVEVVEDRVTYSESVRVNIGDYESRDVHISYSTAIKEDEDFFSAIKRADKNVKKALRSRERQIRESSEDNVDFDTIERLEYYNKGKGK